MRHSPATLLFALCSLSAAAADCPTPSAGPADIRVSGYYSDEAKSYVYGATFERKVNFGKTGAGFLFQNCK